MKTMIIRRVATGEQGTFGVILHNDIPFALSLERQWLDNRPSVGDVPGSCIPSGEYACKRVNSPRFKNTFEVTDVENRTHILFHKGNLDDDSHGCILVGEKFGMLSANAGILESRQGFNEFMLLLEDEDEFSLNIINHF